MRLPKPRSVSILSRDTAGQKSIKGKNFWIKTIVAVVLVAALVFVITNKIRQNDKNAPPENASVSTIERLKNSNNLNDQRSVASEYMVTGDYAQAEATAKAVAEKTQSINDYMTLLNICTVRAVPDKDACINEALSKITPQISSLSFYSTYTTASELDEAGHSKQALPFYQRAYDTYDSVQHDIYTKTKDQIKQRIDQING